MEYKKIYVRNSTLELYTMSFIAEKLGMTARKLNELLFRLKIQKKNKNKKIWMFEEVYRNMEYEKFSILRIDKRDVIDRKITGKGAYFILNKLKENKLVKENFFF